MHKWKLLAEWRVSHVAPWCHWLKPLYENVRRKKIIHLKKNHLQSSIPFERILLISSLTSLWTEWIIFEVLSKDNMEKLKQILIENEETRNGNKFLFYLPVRYFVKHVKKKRGKKDIIPLHFFLYTDSKVAEGQNVFTQNSYNASLLGWTFMNFLDTGLIYTEILIYF